MKIAIIIEHFDPTRGGAEAFAFWLATRLARVGHEVHVVCHDVSARINRYRAATQRASHDAERSHHAHPADPPHESLPEGVHLHRVKGMKLSTALGFRLFGRAARNWCAAHRPDIVHSITIACPGDVYHTQAGVYAEIQAQAAAMRPTQASASFKRFLLRLPGKQRTLLTLEKKAMADPQAPQKIVSISAMVTDQLRRHYAVDPARIIELPNPRLLLPDHQWTEEQARESRAWFRVHYGLAESDRVALFIGHDFRRKGLKFAIQAVAKSTTHWKLLVVGLGKAREYVELAQRLGIGQGNAKQVLFVGPTRQVDAVYAASDVLILPTFYDSFGLVVIEALSHGLPVISTEQLGSAYLVKQHHAGTIVPSPQDVDAMADALDRLPPAGSPEHDALARRARKAADPIDPDHYIKRLLQIYQQTRDEKGKHP